MLNEPSAFGIQPSYAGEMLWPLEYVNRVCAPTTASDSTTATATADCRLLAADCRLPATADCSLFAADCRLPATADCSLFTVFPAAASSSPFAPESPAPSRAGSRCRSRCGSSCARGAYA